MGLRCWMVVVEEKRSMVVDFGGTTPNRWRFLEHLGPLPLNSLELLLVLQVSIHIDCNMECHKQYELYFVLFALQKLLGYI